MDLKVYLNEVQEMETVMFFIFGWSTKTIGSALTPVSCSNCKAPLALVGLQNFFSLFFIPFIPLSKESILVCTNCGAQFPLDGVNTDKQMLPKFKTPWWGYSGLLIIGGILAFGVIGILLT